MRTLAHAQFRASALLSGGKQGGLGRQLIAAPVAALVLFVALFVILRLVFGFAAGTSELKPEFAASVMTAAISMTALIGASLGAVYAFRKQIETEKDGIRADQKAYSERYSKAAELLASERPAARLAGLHSLARLADDWQEGRSMCAMAVSSYLRLPVVLVDAVPADVGELEVRRTAWLTIKQRLVDPTRSDAWHAQEFDFSGGQFDNVDLNLAKFNNMHIGFRGCTFKNGEIRLGGSEFIDARLDFTGSHFENMKIILRGAKLLGSSGIFFDEAQIMSTEFQLDHMNCGDMTNLYWQGATIKETRILFDADDETFIFQDQTSFMNGSVDFSNAKLVDVSFQMHAYGMEKARLVFDDTETCRTEISIPRRIKDSYVNLDIIPVGKTNISIGPGSIEGGNLRMRTWQGAAGSLTVQFINVEHKSGEILVNADTDVWRKFYFDGNDESGTISVHGDFPEAAFVRVNCMIGWGGDTKPGRRDHFDRDPDRV